MNSRSPAPRRAAGPDGLAARVAKYGHVARSLSFFAVAIGWLMLPLGLVQRVAVWPLALLLPARRTRLVGAWFRFHARSMLRLARLFAGVRLRVRGRILPGPCVVVMNHQGLLDIPLVHAIAPGPYPLIPTRDRYRKGIPGISPLTRLARYPFVTQKRDSVEADLAEIRRAADEVAAGEHALAIFPEGHRTRDGEIGPFMQRGLRLILSRARVPVYCVVADGIWGARTFAEAAYKMSGARVDAVVLGPFDPPASDDELPDFVAGLRERMVEALHGLRDGSLR